MASRDVVSYTSPLSRMRDAGVAIFLAIYLIWTVLPILVMIMSSFKDLLEAFRPAS